MNRSNAHLLDLPDEILLFILKKLNNIDVIYSLFDINNGRLNILAQEITSIDILKFVSIDNISIIDRFCNDILPRIHHNVKGFIFDPIFMERILLATDYPNLTKLTIHHFQKEIVSNYFTSNIMEPSVVSYPHLSLCCLPSTSFSSPILTHLYINVQDFDDCLFLLDGRLSKLTTLCIVVYHMDTLEKIVHNMDKLLNLKCFSLKSSYPFQEYDKIVLLLRRMSNLEKLTLNISVYNRNRIIDVIDGTHVQHNILDYMPQLRSFIFYICTYVEPAALSYKLSSEDIQQTLTNIGLQHASSMVNYCAGVLNYAHGVRVAYSIFSLPFEFDYLQSIGNNLPNIVFSYVTYLHIRDIMPFEHEFFMRVARSFPLLKHLCIWNDESQKLAGLMTFPSDNCQLHSFIEYPHLTILDIKFSHADYLEQFLNETKTFVPCLTEFEVFFDDLKTVTKDFTREETRRNCSKVKKISTIQGVVHSKDLCLYFPSLYK
ncbi:unnamed protein product [Adineta steineri]|nr:unnamed protein product [Adineta steineri]